MPNQSSQDGKLFISYRRSDARGIAGRLSDTLAVYFGENRVFRDIENIAGGADFGDVITRALQSADAVIILIGPDWLSLKNEKGQRRLEDPQDWVAQEIASAIELKKPIFPVLVENASMPRAEDLPERLKPLTRYNALSISDDRWKVDVLRLGKIISLEIPSANERRIERVRLAISTSLVTSLSFTAGIFCINFLQTKEPWLQLWQSGIPYVAILGSTLLLSTIANLIDEERRRYIHASIISGTLGSLIFFILLLPLHETQEPVITFLGSIVVSAFMFTFMNMSGFKPK